MSVWREIAALLNKPIYAWRLEHKDTRLGPFEHGGQIPEVIFAINNSSSFMDDIDALPEVKKLLRKNRNAKFAFDSKARVLKFICKGAVLSKHGFIISKWLVHPLFHADGQIIYDSKKAQHVEDLAIK